MLYNILFIYFIFKNEHFHYLIDYSHCWWKSTGIGTRRSQHKTLPHFPNHQMPPMSNSAVADQHAVIGIPSGSAPVPSGFAPNGHPEAAWFGERNFGAFVHWGISSVRAEVDLSWGMIAGTAYDLGTKITPKEYFAQAETFRAESFQPREWLQALAAAGVNHAVFTTKHHDGFAMWPSAHGDFSTKNFLEGRDLVGEFVEACRATGIRPGLYYSPPDWFFNRHRMSFRRASDGSPGNPHLGLEHEPITLPPHDPEWEEKYHAYLRGQIEELLTNYGQIDLLFFDGKPEVISIDRIRELQPSILVNERMHGYGDFSTPECRIPVEAPTGFWEVVDTWDIAGRWGYALPFVNRPASWVAERRGRVASMGGNYMINLAPQADGSLPEEILSDLAWLAKWQYHAKPALAAMQRLPDRIRCNLPAAVNGRDVYLFLPDSLLHLINLTGVPAPESVRLLGSGVDVPHGHIPTFREGPRLNILVPPKAKSGGDIVHVRFTEPVC
jgi:alpha-L-fucosidase